MRTLKKTLCLVLCLAMMVGLCAFGASAAFTDEEAITYKEEVDLLTGIGVINGMGDGSFNPTGTLTRAQAAKIICYLLGYEEVAESTAPFTDVPATHWASGPIALCAAQGIVNGYGDGRFGPEDLLTAEQFQKMLLCALGYDAAVEGMEGPSWEIGVAKIVKKTNLTADIILNPMDKITRDEACKLAYNALQIPEVYYEGGTKVNTSDGTNVEINAQLRTNNTYLASGFGLAVVRGAAVSTYDKGKFNDTVGSTTRVVFEGVVTANSANTGSPKTTLDGATTFNVKTGLDLLGHYVKIYQGTKADASGNKPVYSVADQSTIVKVGRGGIVANETNYAKAFGSKAQYQLTVNEDGTGGAVTPYRFVYNAAVAQGAMTMAPATNTAAANTEYVFYKTATGKLKLAAEIVNGDAEIGLSKITKIVTDAGKETVTITSYGALDNGKLDATGKPHDIVNEYDGMAVGDLVTVSKVGSGTTFIYTVEKVKTVSGSITATSTAIPTAGALTIGGKAYMPSGAAGTTAAAMNATVKGGVVEPIVAPWTLSAAELKGNTYTLYLDPNGDYIACVLDAGTAAATDALYAIYKYHKTEATTYGDTVKYFVQVTDASGKIDNIQIGAKVGATYYGDVDGDDGGATIGLNRFYKFAADDANSLRYGYKNPTAVAGGIPATVGAVGSEALSANTSFKTSTTKATIASGTTYINSATNFIFVTGTGATAKATVKAGAVTQDLTAAGTKILYTKDADGNLIAKAIVYAGAYADTAPDAAKVIFCVNNNPTGTTASGTTYAGYKADTGERITFTVGTTGAPTQAGAAFYTYTETDGIYKLTWLNPATITACKVDKTYEGKMNTTILAGAPDGTGSYEIASDTASAVFADATLPGADLTSLDAIATYHEAHAGAITMSFLLDSKGKTVFAITTGRP